MNGSSITYAVELAARERWEVRIDVVPIADGDEVVPRVVERRFGEERGRVRDSLAAWQLRVPQLRADWDELARSFSQSVSDLASLRMRSSTAPTSGSCPAAGMPWFMTVFGRDTLITCLQTLLFGPELARNALDGARLAAGDRGRRVDRRRAREDRPRGAAGQGGEDLVRALLRHARRDAALPGAPLGGLALDRRRRARAQLQGAGAARARVDRPATATATATASSSSRSARRTGSTSSRGRTRTTRSASTTVAIAESPIAPCEVQGYVYDAKRRMAEIAREVWRDRALAERLDREADELKQRFDEAFWVEDRGGFYALALDGDKQQVDSICSNIGHLLWSRIVPPERVDAIVDQLMGDGLWSGWGVRTMSADEAGYSPL